MPKISIYVPDEMKARMDAAEDRANWSAVAQRAFRVELDHLEAVKEIKTMTDVAERLRASREKIAAEHMKDGLAAGRHWAAHEAEYDELKAVAGMNAVELLEFDDDGWAAACALWGKICPEERPEPSEIAALLGIEEDALDLVLSPGYVSAFVTSAATVWEEVSEQI